MRKNFKQSKEHSEHGRTVWVVGDDTCGNPYMEIHAPYDRVAAPNAFLLYFVDPSERQFATMKQRGKWLKFSTYRKAREYARGLQCS